jgi:hypothetical protein
MPNTQASGVAYSDPEFTTCYASQELGYSAAAQGTVTQATSKSTGVKLNKSAGRITMNNAALGAGTAVSFTLTNSLISANDTLAVNVSGKATGCPALADPLAYTVYVATMTSGSAVLVLRNLSAGSQSEDVIVNYAIIHGAS